MKFRTSIATVYEQVTTLFEVASQQTEDSLRVIELLSAIAPYEEGSVMDPEDVEDLASAFDGKTYVNFNTTDGDVISLTLSKDPVTKELTRVLAETETGVKEIVARSSDTGDVTLSRNTIPSRDVRFEWGVDELLSDVIDSYQSSKTLQAASDLILREEFSVANVEAYLSEISSNLMPNAANLFEFVKTSVLPKSPESLLSMIKEVIKPVKDAVIDLNTIDFAPTDYHVKGLNFTLITNGISSVGEVLGVLLSFVNPLLGIGVFAASGILKGISNIIGNEIATSENVTFDEGSGTRIFAIPVLQRVLNNPAPNVETFINMTLGSHSVAKLDAPGTVAYLRKLEEHKYSLEVFLSLDRIGTSLIPDTFSGRMAYIAKYFDSEYGEYVIEGRYDIWNDLHTNILNQMDYIDSSASDTTIRRALISSLLDLYAFVSTIYDFKNYDGTVELDFSSPSTPEAKVNRFYTVMTSLSNGNWASFVNTNLPYLRDLLNSSDVYAVNYIMTYAEFSYFLYYREYDPSEPSDDYRLKPTYNFAQPERPWVYPPQYSKGATMLGLLLTIVATSVIAAVLVATTIRVKRAIHKKVVKSNLQLESMRQNYLSDPSSANLDAYVKASRRYNRLAPLLGVSRYNAVTGLSMASAPSESGSFLAQLASKTNGELENLSQLTLDEIEKVEQLIH